MIRKTIHGLSWEACGPSHWRLELPELAGRGEVTISYLGDGEWCQFLELDGQVRATIYTTLEDAARPLAIALGTA